MLSWISLPGALWMYVPLRSRRHGGPYSGDLGGGTEDERPANVAGLSRFRSRPRRTAAFPGPVRWLVGAAVTIVISVLMLTGGVGSTDVPRMSTVHSS